MPAPTRFSGSPAIDNPPEARKPGPKAPKHRSLGGRALYKPASVVPTRAPPPDHEAGEFWCDWNDLFNAVKERLTNTVTASTADPLAAADLRAAQVSRAVLECVSALEQLQTSASIELARREGPAMAISETPTSLAQVRTALVGNHYAERGARYKATLDSLTSIPDRDWLIARIAQESARTDPDRRLCAVMLVELNEFERLNASFGHSVSDDLLRIVAARLHRVLLGQSHVSRAAAGAFICLIGGAQDHGNLVVLAERLAHAISAPCTTGALRMTLQARIGIAVCQPDGRRADSLLMGAESALSAAKRQRLEHVFFDGDDETAAVAPPCPAPGLPSPARS